MQKEDLSTDTTFDPCWFSLDYTFKATIPTSTEFLKSDNISKAAEDFETKSAKISQAAFGNMLIWLLAAFKKSFVIGLAGCVESAE